MKVRVEVEYLACGITDLELPFDWAAVVEWKIRYDRFYVVLNDGTRHELPSAVDIEMDRTNPTDVVIFELDGNDDEVSFDPIATSVD